MKNRQKLKEKVFFSLKSVHEVIMDLRVIQARLYALIPSVCKQTK